MVTSEATQDMLFTHNPHMFRECLTPVQHLSRYLSNDFSRDQHLVNIYMSWGSTARPRGGKENVGLGCSYTAAGGLSSSPQPALHKQLGHDEGCVFVAAVTWAPEKARISRHCLLDPLVLEPSRCHEHLNPSGNPFWYPIKGFLKRVLLKRILVVVDGDSLLFFILHSWRHTSKGSMLSFRKLSYFWDAILSYGFQKPSGHLCKSPFIPCMI